MKFAQYHFLFKSFISAILLIQAGLFTSGVQAVTLERATPTGTQARVDNIKLRFSAPMVRSDALAATLQCDGKTVALQGNWQNERDWVGYISEQLTAGSQCEVVLASDLRSIANKDTKTSDLTGATKFKFALSEPTVVEVVAGEGGDRIDANQAFILITNAPIGSPKYASQVEQIKSAGAYCTTNKVGERLGLTLVGEPERRELIAAAIAAGRVSGSSDQSPFKTEAAQKSLFVVRCARPLGDDSDVAMFWRNQRFYFKTRPAFRLNVSCERERPNAPCIPIRPVTVQFTSTISSQSALGIELVDSVSGKVFKSNVSTQMSTLKVGSAEYSEALANEISYLEFGPGFTENSKLRIKFPADLKDSAGRALLSASQKALGVSAQQEVVIGSAPPLAKFAANFGIVERQVGALPITVRRMGDLKLYAQHTTDVQTIIQWLHQAHFDEKNEFVTRAYPLIAPLGTAVDLPTLKDSKKDAAVVGIPLQKTGLHRLEVQSQTLGDSVLPPGAQGARPMYVRSNALVTGMAVHLKTSPVNTLIWVTSLETGKPVANAELTLADCNGQVLWQGRSDASGIGKIEQAIAKPNCAQSLGRARTGFKLVTPPKPAKPTAGEAQNNDQAVYDDDRNWLVAFAKTSNDVSFVLSTWNQGIEPWRFNVPYRYGESDRSEIVAHTIFARSLLRQGEVVHMKHLFRRSVATGLASVNLSKTYGVAVITHLGSDQEFEVPLQWLGSNANSQWTIPKDAKLGMYKVSTKPASRDEQPLELGSFQVAQFRLPVLRGAIDVKQDGAALADKNVKARVQMSYMNGGPARGLAASMSAQLSSHAASFSSYSDFNFASANQSFHLGDSGDGDKILPAALKNLLKKSSSQLVLDKQAVTLDDSGSATVAMTAPLTQPTALLVELNYQDPNGEIQTVSQRQVLWPAQLVLGAKDDTWLDGVVREHQFIAVSPEGKPLAGVAVVIEGFQRVDRSVRKRMVGGFYSFDNTTEYFELGNLCSGKTDASGSFICSVKADQLKLKGGSVMLLARARDAQGVEVTAGKTVWSYGGDNDWTAQKDGDRIDLIPEKRVVMPGEVARFQVRLPFEQATALVAIEREGIIKTILVDISRANPVFEVPITAEYAPNVMVSVLAIRPRLEPLGIGSFFKWGWRAPFAWWEARKNSLKPATALVDLAKPSFRFGLTEIQVPPVASAKVQVQLSNAKVQPRELVKASISVDGESKAKAPRFAAVAVVDEALLELSPNSSWDLLKGLWRSREHAVETSTAQMLVVGKRHFGLKAQAPGGGGGRSPSRELLETLVYWNPQVALNAQGKAQIEFKANDSLTRFKVIVFVDDENDLIGTGQTSFDVTKDLQLASGLTPIVREADRVVANATLRNTTNRKMSVQFKASLGSVVSTQQTIELAAQTNVPVTWEYVAPLVSDAAGGQDNEPLQWTLSVQEASGSAADELKVIQTLMPAVRRSVVSAQLVRIDGTTSVPLQAVAAGLPGRSVVRSEFAASLLGSTGPVTRFFERYPFACLEQRTSKTIGLRDTKLWATLVESLPVYLDSAGLASYYPLSATSEADGGSDVLTAYLLTTAHAATADGLKFDLPEASRGKMLAGLGAFIEGKIKRRHFAPDATNAMVARQLTALEALSRYGKVTANHLTIIDPQPASWPTSAVIDWASVLTRLSPTSLGSQAAVRERQLDEAWQVLRNRMTLTGTQISFDNEERDAWWWMMADADRNAARLVHLIMESAPRGRSAVRPALAEWIQDVPRLVSALVARQRGGTWTTTTANVWGSLALERYARQFEREKVTGQTQVVLTAAGSTGAPSAVTYELSRASNSLRLPAGSADSSISLKHEGTGKPYAVVALEAAIPATAPVSKGFTVVKKIVPVSQAQSGKILPGDTFRVELEITALQSMSWVALQDPIPAGSTIQGPGGELRTSQIEQNKSEQQRSEQAKQSDAQSAWRYSGAWLAFEERRFDSYQAIYEYMPRGTHRISYVLRVSQAGTAQLPTTRVEAMYAPGVYGEAPNANWVVVKP